MTKVHVLVLTPPPFEDSDTTWTILGMNPDLPCLCPLQDTDFQRSNFSQGPIFHVAVD